MPHLRQASSPSPEATLFWLAGAQDADLPEDLLGPDEQARHRRFLSPARRLDFLAGRALLRFALAAHGLPQAALTFLPSGRPSLMTAGADVSLAHASGHVLVAIGFGGLVGVDVEAPAPRERALMDRFLHAEERAWIGDSLERLHAVWTVKEAALKALGTGVSGNPLNVRVDGEGGPLRVSDIEPARIGSWQAHEHGMSAAAVLICHKPPPHPVPFLVNGVAPNDLAAWARAQDRRPLRNIA